MPQHLFVNVTLSVYKLTVHSQLSLTLQPFSYIGLYFQYQSKHLRHVWPELTQLSSYGFPLPTALTELFFVLFFALLGGVYLASHHGSAIFLLNPCVLCLAFSSSVFICRHSQIKLDYSWKRADWCVFQSSHMFTAGKLGQPSTGAHCCPYITVCLTEREEGGGGGDHFSVTTAQTRHRHEKREEGHFHCRPHCLIRILSFKGEGSEWLWLISFSRDDCIWH